MILYSYVYNVFLKVLKSLPVDSSLAYTARSAHRIYCDLLHVPSTPRTLEADSCVCVSVCAYTHVCIGIQDMAKGHPGWIHTDNAFKCLVPAAVSSTRW